MGWSLWIINFISIPKECVNEFIENMNMLIQKGKAKYKMGSSHTKYPGYSDMDCIGKGCDVQKIDLNDEYAACLGNEIVLY
jgi:hypothetical protein